MQSKATNCPVLYDANGLLIVDKPEGVLSHPNVKSGLPAGRCAFEGPYHFERRCFKTPEGPVWLIHRLDQDTSGILIATRTERTAEQCRAEFESGRIRKYYATLVSGTLKPRSGEWRDFILTEKKAGRARSRILPRHSKNASLRYSIQNYFGLRPTFTLLRIELLTGKTHQIRIQSASRNHPIAGDEIYGNFPLNRELRKSIGLRRLFLHAGELELKNPDTGKTLHIKAPMPESLKSVLSRLAELQA
ncbi:MAG TPA: RluA family pseudouridine synthase [Candidatus Omnitrophota bacterium]|nr:RluA family pseudouridine synthase [Candidatus Omnitrophota bacterium]